MKCSKGFTLAEILGIVLLIGFLLLITVPPLANQLNKTKEKSKDTEHQIIFIACSQYITENKTKFPPGKKYCIKISELINAGKLVSPVLDAETGENLENSSVLVYLYSSGSEIYEIKKDSSECENKSSLPMIDFIVTPNINTWTNKDKVVQVLYPSNGKDHQTNKNNSGWIKQSNPTNTKIVFNSNGELEAKMNYTNSIIQSKIYIGKIDKEPPTIKLINEQEPCFEISFTDTGGSNLKNYSVTNSNQIPTENDSRWVSLDSLSNKVINNPIKSNGTYYIHVKDNAGNISNYKLNNIRVVNKITFDANGGNVLPNNKDIINGNSYETPVPTRTGYTFLGWFTSKTGGTEIKSTDKVCLKENKTLYAHWKANKYIIKFEPNIKEASGSTKSIECTYDSQCTLTNNGFTKKNYYFQGWSMTKTGTKQYNNEEKVNNLATSGEITLYGVWDERCSKTRYVAGSWSSWSKCTKECDGGTKKRTRTISIVSDYDNKKCSKANNSVNEKPKPEEKQTCNTESCKYNAKEKGGVYVSATRDGASWDGKPDGTFAYGTNNQASGNWTITVKEHSVRFYGTKGIYATAQDEGTFYYRYCFTVKSKDQKTTLGNGCEKVYGTQDKRYHADKTISW